MKNLFFAFLLISVSVQAQDYWQQEVNYKINVALDDKTHTLRGFEEFEYINNSPDILNRIYIHIWPNAYKDKNTALARQQYKDGNQDLTYGSDDLKGNIDSLDFKINGEKANWTFHHHEDIAILELNSPLAPGQRITVSTPFKVNIPSGSISRLGHIGESYQITQWYPKPAVYDKQGWHHMPYLNQGEFFSEYGSFDVKITLPKNYVVGATGDLQTESEIQFMNDLAEKTAREISNVSDSKITQEKVIRAKTPNITPESSKELKTIQFTQSNVHDFAWFADKRYKVLKGQVDLPNSKRRVTSWALFTPKNESLWKNAIEYINDATYYYSLWNGNYPYNQVTAVDGTISAGGGMEYPNVTVIGNSSNARELEVVIVHEVGHNWFYGQLGTNERVHGWMDEGMNTLNEVRYMQTKYPDNTAMSDMVLGGRFHMDHLDHHDMSDISFRAIAGIGEDQPIETHSAEFTSVNYGIVMYQKTGLVFFYLRDYLGDELFDKCMQAYYSEWEFKHPQPDDMRRTLELESGYALSWLFDDLINTTNHIDYKIARVKKKDGGYYIKVKNVGQVDGPIEIVTLKDGEVVETKWAQPGSKSVTYKFNEEFDQISIDPDKDIPELNRQNNHWKSNGLFKKVESPKLEFLLGDNESDRTNIFWTPTIGGNYYDKFMIGVGVHNYGVPFNKVNYLVMPFYSFGRQFVSGVSELSYTSLPKKNLKLSRIGVSVKSFKHDTVYRHNDSYFISIAPYWFAKLGNRKAASPASHNLRLQTVYKKDQFGPTHMDHAGAYIEYDYNFVKVDHTLNFKARNEFMANLRNGDQMGRIMIESTYKIRFMRAKKERWAEVRLFAGKQYLNSSLNVANNYTYGMSLSGQDGRQDLFVDEYYFGRNQSTGIWSQQRNSNMGGFRSTSNFGTTSDWMTTANAYFQIPYIPKFIGIFADYGLVGYNFAGTTNTIESAANVGLAIRMGDIFGVYFPVWMTENLEKSYSTADYAERIRFTLKFNLMQKSLNLNKLL